MSQRVKRPTSPDPDALEEDERMYGEESASVGVNETAVQISIQPLIDLRKNASGPVPGRPKTRTGGGASVQEQKRHIIERFVSRWRAEVGDDFYPAMRLILPDKDRDRTVYGLKESNIGKLLVKLLKIDRNSEDGYNLLHWKLPGQTFAARMAGDFPGRCYEVISKRPMRTEVGDLTVADVNELLDKLSASSSETENLAVFQIFYLRMNAEEMLWLIRIILKQMKIGASESTVCWQLRDPSIRLQQEETGLRLGQPFQPQLAQFQTSTTFSKMVNHLGVTEDDPEYWIEVKLDGERMQLHMSDSPDKPGGKSFFFCSRKAKDYTELYGSGYEEPSALTRFLKGAFSPKVRNVILDGEMVAWNMKEDMPDAFGSLKTAANKEKTGVAGDGAEKDLRPYTLRDRYRALQSAVPGMKRRLEIHPHVSSTSPDNIETELRTVIAEEARASFLCGLRVGENEIATGANPEKCKSFFKVGGGFKAEDYAEVRHHTEGKWIKWDSSKPPTEYISLAGGERLEKPDVWIRPRDSVVISAKAASITESKTFAAGWDSALNEDEFDALRERVKADQETKDMKVENRKRRPTKRAKKELVIAGTDAAPVAFSGPKTKVFEGLEFCVLSDAAKPVKKTKAQLEAVIKENGGEVVQRPAAGTGMILVADRKLVGVASLMKKGDVDIIRPKWVLDCVAQSGGGYLLPYEDGHLFHATPALLRSVDDNTDRFGDSYARDVDLDELAQILRDMPKLEGLTNPFDKDLFTSQLRERGHGLEGLKSQMFNRCVVYFYEPGTGAGAGGDEEGAPETGSASSSGEESFRLGNYVRFGGGGVVGYLGDPALTHVVVVDGGVGGRGVGEVRKEIAARPRIPRIVTGKWVEESWKEGTLLDEESYTAT
ncbi:unnamed protein product [Parascedosporium putredinis]|uniref:DNA ligase 4 n=1 Tax=Parascedosporium putredinis TaxID=1442378 RepID=A0A9P1MFS2_9PEZI|nr:unnamed protein product [Parascedosporium putredinis]CAI8002990.1 unnamed protein product [Parascedosporium putredinis]